MNIGGRAIGPGEAPYVIAEIGVNHDGSVARALELVDGAAEAGADAVKLQHFEAERLMSRASRLAAYQADAGERDPVEMLRRLELSVSDMGRIVERAHARGVHAIVTVFSASLVPGALTHAWDALKTASPDIVNRPLLDALGAADLPLIVSTGAAELDEIERCIGWLEEARAQQRLALLQCVSSYPCPADQAAVGGVIALRERFGLPTGYSDHTSDEDTGALAVSLGACILEKHLTWSNEAQGPDHAASLEPDAFARYVALAREAAHHGPTHAPVLAPARGGGSHAIAADPRVGPYVKRLLPCERDVRAVSRQSLVAIRDIPAGATLAPSDLTVKRPGTGLAPFRLQEVAGRRLARAVRADVPLQAEDFE